MINIAGGTDGKFQIQYKGEIIEVESESVPTQEEITNIIVFEILKTTKTNAEQYKEQGREEIRIVVRKAFELFNLIEQLRKHLEDKGVLPKK